MKIRLWRGFHSLELRRILSETWKANDELLIVCPPNRDGSSPSHFNFLKHLAYERLEWLGDWPTLTPSLPNSNSGPRFDGELPVVGVFTSGTLSGVPRLALYTRANIESSVGTIASLFSMERIRDVFCYAQPFHTFGLTLGYTFAMLYELNLITPAGRYDKSAHAQRLAVASEDLLTLGTPTHFYDLLSFANNSKIEPSYSCIAGGASVSQTLWRRMRDELLIEAPSIGYGCTEASPGIAHVPPGQEPLVDNEIGFPLSNLTSRLTEGGVEISGASLCTAIIDKSGLQRPQKLIIRDRVHARPDGSWIYDGRLDLQLNRGGEKFSLENIETALTQKLNLHALAVAVPDERLGEDLGLLVQSPESIDSAALTDFLAATFKLRFDPRHLHLCDRLPQNSSFKLDRAAARRRFLS